MNLFLRTVFALLLACPLCASAQGRLLPVDQAISVPDFYSFRAQLQAAIARRDIDAVSFALSKDVKLSFGGDAGVDDFRKIWKPDTPDSRLWEVLGSALALGGSFAPDGTFTAPYVFTRWPQDREPFAYVAVIAAGVRVRSAPGAGSAPIASLDFSIIELAGPTASGAQWVEVKVSKNRTGYVEARLLRSPVDYRVNFAKIDGRWQIRSFLAGD